MKEIDTACHGPTLDAIAINEKHERFTLSPEGLGIGEMLRKRREMFGPDGQGFVDWCETNLDFSYITALLFIKAAEMAMEKRG